MKLIESILTISSLVVFASILILIFLTTSKSVSLEQFRWPSSPELKTEIKETNFAFENLLAPGEGLDEVKKHCLGCHSSRLIIQNRMTRENWEENIKWMQETQGLWNLGMDHKIVIDYLALQYAPQEVGRRNNLDNSQLEWYLLNE